MSSIANGARAPTLSPDDILALSRLFDAAQELPERDRDDWLAALPTCHQHLATALREMLAVEAFPTGTGPLARLPQLDGARPLASAGELVGPYRLLREIGRGGMASVWLAERADGSYERKVAIKLPTSSWCERMALRMARERRIAALLEHPNIARLYTAGLAEGGRPYIAMQYIDGVSIDRWCKEKRLGVRERLLLYLQVLDAVAYAHSQGVLHRDLKPTNILVDQKGRAHLLDFGIAKLIGGPASEQDLTQEVGRVLTLQYAAPEQITGRPVSVVTDVYGLGVMLFELLTGKFPYTPKRRTPAAFEEAVLEGDMRFASSVVQQRELRRALQGEVDAIVAKALRRNPERRYPSVDAMAADISRYLAGEPVHAQLPACCYRLRKTVVRRSGALVATAAILVTAALGAAVSTVQAQRAATEAEHAQLVTGFASDVFRLNASHAFGTLHAGAVLDKTARLIDTRFADQPEVQAELDGAVARIYVDMGAGGLARPFAGKYLSALERIGASRDQRAKALQLLSDATFEDEDATAAEGFARQAVALTRADVASGLEARSTLARIVLHRGKVDEGRQLLAAMERQWPEGDKVPFPAVVSLLTARAELLMADDHFDGAVPLLRTAIDKAVAAEGSLSWLANNLRVELAMSLVTHARPVEARPLFSEAVDALNAAGDPGRVQAAVLSAHYWRIMAEGGFAPLAEARMEIERSLATLAPSLSSLAPRVPASVELELALVDVQWGDLERADQLMHDAAPAVAAETGSWSQRMAFDTWRGALDMKLGRHDVADQVLRHQLDLRRQKGLATQAPAAMEGYLAAMNLVMAARPREAAELLARFPRFLRAPGHDADVLPAMAARVELELGDVAAARDALPILDGPITDDRDAMDLAPHALAGEIDCASGHARRGYATLRAWLDAISPSVGPDEPAVARVRALAGLCALHLGERTTARDLARRAAGALATHPQLSAWYARPLLRLQRALGTGPCLDASCTQPRRGRDMLALAAAEPARQ